MKTKIMPRPQKLTSGKLCLDLELTSEILCFYFEQTPELIFKFDHVWQCPKTKMFSNSLGHCQARKAFLSATEVT